MQTFVKLMLRLITNVTTSPACSRRISSAVAVTAARSRPTVVARTRPSSSEISCPSSARERMSRTAGDARSSHRTALPLIDSPRPSNGLRLALPASPVFMALLDTPVSVDQVVDARAKRFVEELGTCRELRIDGETLAEREARGFG